MADFSFIIDLLPPNRLLSKLEIIELVASRSEFSGVWKVQLPSHRVPSNPIELFGLKATLFRKLQNSKGSSEPLVQFEELKTWEQELIVWLTERIKGRFLLTKTGMLYFEDPKEAMMFKLTWA